MALLTKAEAKALLSREVPVAQPPVLDDADLEDLVAQMVTLDAEGRWPTEADWEESYDRTQLNFAAYKAWDRKAGRVANLETFTADGATHNAGELHKQCLRMKRQYLSRCSGSATVGSCR